MLRVALSARVGHAQGAFAAGVVDVADDSVLFVPLLHDTNTVAATHTTIAT